MWELDHKEGWVPENWCLMVVLEKTLGLQESLGLQGDPTSQSSRKSIWVFIGRTDAEAEAPVLWPPDAKSQFIRKDPDAGKDWRQEEKGTTADEMVGWQHWLNEHEFEQTLGDGEGQGSLVCCCPWGYKKLNTIERLNLTELNKP